MCTRKVGSGREDSRANPSGGKQEMVWIPAGPDSNLPNHWVEERANEASRFRTESYSSREWQNSSPGNVATILSETIGALRRHGRGARYDRRGMSRGKRWWIPPRIVSRTAVC